MAHPKMQYPWHQDSAKMTKPNELVGKTFLHVKTNKLYKVTGYRLNTTNDKWMIDYCPLLPSNDDLEFGFSRDMDQFTDGRFAEVW